MSKINVFRFIALVTTVILVIVSYGLYFPDKQKSAPAASAPRSYFAMCLIVKNDELDLLEWVEYHRRMGCSKFYIFDHNSTVPQWNVIKEHVDSGLVTYEYGNFSFAARPQMYVYDKCLQDYGKQHQFIGFLDSDEFIVVANKSLTIPDVLRRYEAYGGLVLNWKVFGTSGHVKRPPGGVLPNYRMCQRNFHIKTIGNTQYTLKSGSNPHEFRYLPTYYAVDTNFTRVNGPFNPKVSTTPAPALFEVMYINHYNLKSKEDYERKVAKGKADNSPPSADGLFNYIDTNAKEDCGILEMPPPLNRKLNY